MLRLRTYTGLLILRHKTVVNPSSTAIFPPGMNSKPVDQARSQDTSIPARGLSASRYAHTKQELVDVINNLRSNGAYLDVE